VLNESLSWNAPVGAAIVIVGILLTQQRIRLEPSRRRARSAQATSSGALPAAPRVQP
jgi:hypothetical protein